MREIYLSPLSLLSSRQAPNTLYTDTKSARQSEVGDPRDCAQLPCSSTYKGVEQSARTRSQHLLIHGRFTHLRLFFNAITHFTRAYSLISFGTVSSLFMRLFEKKHDF